MTAFLRSSTPKVDVRTPVSRVSNRLSSLLTNQSCVLIPITSRVRVYRQTFAWNDLTHHTSVGNVGIMLWLLNLTKTAEEQEHDTCLDAAPRTKISNYTNFPFYTQTQRYYYDHKFNSAASQTTEISISTVCPFKTSETSNCSFTLEIVSFELHPRLRQSISSKPLNDPDLPT